MLELSKYQVFPHAFVAQSNPMDCLGRQLSLGINSLYLELLERNKFASSSLNEATLKIVYSETTFINIFERFMLHSCIDLHQLRIIVD